MSDDCHDNIRQEIGATDTYTAREPAELWIMCEMYFKPKTFGFFCCLRSDISLKIICLVKNKWTIAILMTMAQIIENGYSRFITLLPSCAQFVPEMFNNKKNYILKDSTKIRTI